MNLLILYAVLTIALSFFCSILEAVLLSVNPTYLKIKISEGKKYAFDLQKMRDNIDEPLIIILTLYSSSAFACGWDPADGWYFYNLFKQTNISAEEFYPFLREDTSAFYGSSGYNQKKVKQYPTTILPTTYFRRQ